MEDGPSTWPSVRQQSESRQPSDQGNNAEASPSSTQPASSEQTDARDTQTPPPKPWYEGLTPQERADAKRRYKNRKGVERWRKRKQTQKAQEREAQLAQQEGKAGTAEPDAKPEATGKASPSRSPSQTPETRGQYLLEAEKLEDGETDGQRKADGDKSTSPHSSDEMVIPETTQAGRMLHEFSKLGKGNEAKTKALLDTMASYAMIPHGFQRHKGRIVRLSEEILNNARDGAPSLQDIAQRFLGWGIKFSNAWEDPEIPNFHQIMSIFARGADRSTFVKVALQDGSSKTVSLRQLSLLDEAVHKELYIGLIHQILREMPSALQKNQAAQRAKFTISKQMKQASMVASGYVIGQFMSFTTQRAIRKNVAVPMQGMVYAAASLGLHNECCKRMWQVWEATKKDLQPLLEKHNALEHRLDSLLILHDISTDGSYQAIFNAVEQLMQNYEDQFDVSYFADLKCSHELLTPLQVGLLAAAQVPKLPVRQILAENIDPYPRMSVVFESGAVPRFN